MIVKGDKVILYTYDNGVWKMGACFRSVSLNVSTDFIETSVTGNGSFASFVPTKHSFTGTADGIVSLNMPGMLTLPEFRALQLAKSVLLMRFQRTDIGGNLYTDECRFFISNSTDNSSFDNINLFSLELRGTGRITQIFTPTTNSNTVTRYEYTGVGGETGFTDPILIGKNVIEANKDGLGNSKIILSGTPVNKEMKFDSATGHVEWAQTFDPSEEAYIIYQ